MPISPANALRAAVFQRLAADAPLVARLGAARIYDEAPRGAPTPYVSLGRSLIRDWSTTTDRGDEHALTIDIWSTRPGSREALEIASLAADALDNAALALTDHRLVNMRVLDVEAVRENAGRFTRARLRLRAVTERQ